VLFDHSRGISESLARVDFRFESWQMKTAIAVDLIEIIYIMESLCGTVAVFSWQLSSFYKQTWLEVSLDHLQ
jgi:TRAP-type mannitol/chloroaromatic compound transport system permease small subunit